LFIFFVACVLVYALTVFAMIHDSGYNRKWENMPLKYAWCLLPYMGFLGLMIFQRRDLFSVALLALFASIVFMFSATGLSHAHWDEEINRELRLSVWAAVLVLAIFSAKKWLSTRANP
jgi:cytochrome bd-type quinol oxidase subunit 2